MIKHVFNVSNQLILYLGSISLFFPSPEYISFQVHDGEYTTLYETGDKSEEIILDDSAASNLQFVTSPWATKCLVFDNYLYNCHSSHNNKQYWRCHNYSR